MIEEDAPPEPHLMESMRAVGYTLESAIADLVDNSITASASTVRVFFSTEPESYVAIVDDGTGMSGSEARHAMRLAGNSSQSQRSPTDLGRFGLGLKTASFSQCRELTIVSKHHSGIVGVRWSLDHLAASGRWSLLILSSAEIASLPRSSELDKVQSGTLVLWRELDRLPLSPVSRGRALDEGMARVRDHLSLVFHRFLAGEHGRGFQILLNDAPLPKVDPFLSTHRATQIGPLESFFVNGERVDLRPYTLPFLSKLNSIDRERAQVAGRMRDSQGFYIYRAMRLVIWGTWFRIVPKNDLGKLARVKVDIPNTLDHLWALDIKKSAAVPPPLIRNELRRIVDQIIAPSRNVHLYRGRTEPSNDEVIRTWELIKDRQSFRYEINRSHPIVAGLRDQLSRAEESALEAVLRLLESAFPVEDVYNRLSEDDVHEPATPSTDGLDTLARAVWDLHKEDGGSVDDFINRLAHAEPFNRSENPRALLRRATQPL